MAGARVALLVLLAIACSWAAVDGAQDCTVYQFHKHFKAVVPCRVCKFVLAKCEGDRSSSLCKAFAAKHPGILDSVAASSHQRCERAKYCKTGEFDPATLLELDEKASTVVRGEGDGGDASSKPTGLSNDPMVLDFVPHADFNPFFDYISPFGNIKLVHNGVHNAADGETQCLELRFNIECPNHCSGHGKCEGGACHCDSGYTQRDCSGIVVDPAKPTVPCPGTPECSDKGECSADGICSCQEGYGGTDCSKVLGEKECPAPGNPPQECAGHGKCNAGTCECEVGWRPHDCLRPAGVAVECDPIDCNKHGVCEKGECKCDANWTGSKCDQKRCPKDCLGRGECEDGRCNCREPFAGEDCSQITCPGDCNGHGKCNDGLCDCDPGWLGGLCADKACPTNCTGHGTCQDAECVCENGWDGWDCSVEKCPGMCNGHGICGHGLCSCEPGWAGAGCAVEVCPNMCNGHGKCENNWCKCDKGFYGLGCEQSSCPNDCTGHGQCNNGTCVCDDGYSGVDCSVYNHPCPRNCSGHGVCNSNGVCDCTPPYTGVDCSLSQCPENCNARGDCNDGVCTCFAGFSGPSCAIRGCPGNCSDHGTCKDGTCQCDEGWSTADCSVALCPNDCNARGDCVNGQCQCHAPYSGDDCSQKGCLNDCSGNGKCEDGTCVCEGEWTGADCSVAKQGIEAKLCPKACSGHGTCDNGVCQCDDGWMPEDCGTARCPDDCNARGRCDNGTCACFSGFSGLSCEVKACINNCTDNGDCVNGTCQCSDGWTGVDCSESVPGACPKDCCGSGACIGGKCHCMAGFFGDDCCSTKCPSDCHHHGACVEGACQCYVGWSGVACNILTCPKNCTAPNGKCEDDVCKCELGWGGEACDYELCPRNCSMKGKCLKNGCDCDDGWGGADCDTLVCPGNCTGHGSCLFDGCYCDALWDGLACDVPMPNKTNPDVPNVDVKPGNGTSVVTFRLEGLSTADMSKNRQSTFKNTVAKIAGMDPADVKVKAVLNATGDDAEGRIKMLMVLPTGEANYMYGLVEGYKTDARNNSVLMELGELGVRCISVVNVDPNPPRGELCYSLNDTNPVQPNVTEPIANTTNPGNNTSDGNSTEPITEPQQNCTDCVTVESEPVTVTGPGGEKISGHEQNKTKVVLMYHLKGKDKTPHLIVKYNQGSAEAPNTQGSGGNAQGGGPAGGAWETGQGGSEGFGTHTSIKGGPGQGSGAGASGKDSAPQGKKALPNPLHRCRNDCSGNGECVPATYGPAYCKCKTGWFGEDCSIPADDSVKKPDSPSSGETPAEGQEPSGDGQASMEEKPHKLPSYQSMEDMEQATEELAAMEGSGVVDPSAVTLLETSESGPGLSEAQKIYEGISGWASQKYGDESHGKYAPDMAEGVSSVEDDEGDDGNAGSATDLTESGGDPAKTETTSKNVKVIVHHLRSGPANSRGVVTVEYDQPPPATKYRGLACPYGCAGHGQCKSYRSEKDGLEYKYCHCNEGYTGVLCNTYNDKDGVPYVNGCMNNCLGHGQCINSKCTCDFGYSGEDCSLPPSTLSQPTTTTIVTTIKHVYKGENITGHGPGIAGMGKGSVGTSNDNDFQCPNACSGHGQCMMYEDHHESFYYCECQPGYLFPDCLEGNGTSRILEKPEGCPNNCTFHGECLDGTCVCEPGYEGADCSRGQLVCTGHGHHVLKKPDNATVECSCNAGWQGLQCDVQNATAPGGVFDPVHGNSTGAETDLAEQEVASENSMGSGMGMGLRGVLNLVQTGEQTGLASKSRQKQGALNPLLSEFPDAAKPRAPGKLGKCASVTCTSGKCVCVEQASTLQAAREDVNTTETIKYPDSAGEEPILCPRNCSGHGVCLDYEDGARTYHYCKCQDEWAGPDCLTDLAKLNSPGVGAANANGTSNNTTSPCPNACAGHGKCDEQLKQCTCDDGYTGRDCTALACPHDCFKQGECVDGRCVCLPGFTGIDCHQAICPRDCSTHGTCQNGKCICDPGFAGPDCSIAGCPNGCSGKGTCRNAVCVCDAGFGGDDCSERECPNQCSGRGDCGDGSVCSCYPGYTGYDCSNIGCPRNCSAHGECRADGCHCSAGWAGLACNQAAQACPNHCSNHGTCQGTGECKCDAGYAEADCSHALNVCPNDCSTHGTCNGDTKTCVCHPGFNGADCSGVVSNPRCPSDCGGHGTCDSGICVCASGWEGPDCLQQSPTTPTL